MRQKIIYEILQLAKKLGFSPRLGTRTNVVEFPSTGASKFFKKNLQKGDFDSVTQLEDNAQKALDQVATGKLNDQELMQVKNNFDLLDRFFGRKAKPADVVDIATGKPVSKEGIAALEEASEMGRMTRFGKKAEELGEEAKMGTDEYFEKKYGMPGPQSAKIKEDNSKYIIERLIDEDLIEIDPKNLDELDPSFILERELSKNVVENLPKTRDKKSLDLFFEKIKNTRDRKGRLPDDPNFDPDDVEFADGGLVPPERGPMPQGLEGLYRRK